MGTCGRTRLRAKAHTPPSDVVQVEVVVVDPALRDLQMPAIIFLVSVGDQNPSGFTSADNGHYLIGFGVIEVRVQEFIATISWGLQYRRVPLLGPVRYPVLVLLGDATEFIASDPLALTVGVEKTDDSFRLLERLDQSVQQQPVKAPVVEHDVILVMLEKGVHENLQCGQIPGPILRAPSSGEKGYQGRSPWLVSPTRHHDTCSVL